MTRTLRCLPLSAFAVLLLAGALRADAPTGDGTVPDCVGLDVAAAQSLAKNAGFETSLVHGAQGAPGTVVSQEPGGLAVRPVGGTIALQVAGAGGAPAQPPTERPDPKPEPRPTLPEAPPAGPVPSPMEPLPPPTVTPTPPPEGPATLPPAPEPSGPPAGSSVDIDALPVDALPNTEGPLVPTVLGLNAAQARARLTAWNLEVELILASPEATGRVVEQYPKPTSTLAEGETVTVVLGASQSPGPEHRQVPLLVGLTADEAVDALKKVGFEPVLRSVLSTSADRGRVLFQTPKRFSFAQKGLGVRVSVGRGGRGAAEPVAPQPGSTTPPSPSDPPTGPATEPPPSPPVGPPTDVPAPPPTEPVVPPTPPGPPPAPPKPAPGAVTLLGPADSENYPRAYGANFEWRTVPNADGYEWELQQEAGGGWRQARTEKLIGTKFRPARMEIGRYRWRVRALNGDTPGSWSDFRLLYLY